jgi:UDP-N-acetylmuramoylalanine--D-glutamate ligase
MEAYSAAKERIFRFQSPDDWAVLNADDPISRGFQPPGRVARFSLAEPVEGAYLDGPALVLQLGGDSQRVCDATSLALRGRHNLANALTACVTACLGGANLEAMRSVLGSFEGLPHRLQRVGRLNGVTFIDDSIATSPERSIAALEAFDEPIVLLAGGRDKHLPMDDWARMIRARVGGVVLFGEAREKIDQALKRVAYPRARVRIADSLPLATRAGYELAEPGGLVLLSPGCTSYDMYRDFVERGQAFAATVAELAGERP